MKFTDRGQPAQVIDLIKPADAIFIRDLGRVAIVGIADRSAVGVSDLGYPAQGVVLYVSPDPEQVTAWANPFP